MDGIYGLAGRRLDSQIVRGSRQNEVEEPKGLRVFLCTVLQGIRNHPARRTMVVGAHLLNGNWTAELFATGGAVAGGLLAFGHGQSVAGA